MKEFKIHKPEIIGKHIQVPQRESGIFDLPAPAFKIYVWLLSHNNGFKFNRKYIDAGVKMHHKTVTNNLKILAKCGAIKNVTSDIKNVTSDIKVYQLVYQLKKKENHKRENVKTDISLLESKSTVENVTSDISSSDDKTQNDVSGDFFDHELPI